MPRLASWCPQGAQMFTFDDMHRRVDALGVVLGYACPQCGRVVKASKWSDAQRAATGDSRGWLGTSNMRWPRHYSWAAPVRRSRAKESA